MSSFLEFIRYHIRLFRFFFKELPLSEWPNFIPWMFLDVVIKEDSRLRAPLFCQSLTIVNSATLFSHENIYIRSALDTREGNVRLYGSHMILGNQPIVLGQSDA